MRPRGVLGLLQGWMRHLGRDVEGVERGGEDSKRGVDAGVGAPPGSGLAEWFHAISPTMPRRWSAESSHHHHHSWSPPAPFSFKLPGSHVLRTGCRVLQLAPLAPSHNPDQLPGVAHVPLTTAYPHPLLPSPHHPAPLKLSVGSGIEGMGSNHVRPIRTVHYEDPTDRLFEIPTRSPSLS